MAGEHVDMRRLEFLERRQVFQKEVEVHGSAAPR
jgi:hypothetical protein